MTKTNRLFAWTTDRFVSAIALLSEQLKSLLSHSLLEFRHLRLVLERNSPVFASTSWLVGNSTLLNFTREYVDLAFIKTFFLRFEELLASGWSHLVVEKCVQLLC